MNTLLPDELVHPFGVTECHGVYFQHRSDRGGWAPVVSVQVPEGLGLFKPAMKTARRLRARVQFLCDTAEQAQEIQRRGVKALPQHRPVSLERAAAGAWALAS